METVATTARLILRQYTAADAVALHQILGDPVTMAFWPAPFMAEQTAGWLSRSLAMYAERGYGRWAVIERASGEQIGDVGLMPTTFRDEPALDVGYIIHAARWRRGFAVEAAFAVVAVARARLTEPWLVANMAHDHRGSARVAERLGMQLAGEFLNPRNRDIRTLLYAMPR